MRITHFEALRPVCPACRLTGALAPLALACIEAETLDDVEAGILQCPSCGREYPILDGLPVIVPDPRRYLSDNLFYLMARSDLTPAVAGVLGDAAGPGSGFDAIRQHLSSYAFDHWADRDPQGSATIRPTGLLPGGIARILARGLDMAGPVPPGPVLDIGCGAGRTVAELCLRGDALVLGVDVSVPLARLARRALVEGRVDYGLRRIGLVYEQRGFPLGDEEARRRADIWICDALALPFGDATFTLAVGLNLLDCLQDPAAGLREFARILAQGGAAVLCTPFDWSANVTPPENWLGGHSARGQHGGSGQAVVEMLLGEGPHSLGTLRLAASPAEHDWQVRLHDRSVMSYTVSLVAARRATFSNPA